MICINQKVMTEKEVTAAAKLFYGWLKINTDKLKEGNDYFAETFGVTKMTVINWLFSLEKKKIIKINYYKKTREIIL